MILGAFTAFSHLLLLFNPPSEISLMLGWNVHKASINIKFLREMEDQKESELIKHDRVASIHHISYTLCNTWNFILIHPYGWFIHLKLELFASLNHWDLRPKIFYLLFAVFLEHTSKNFSVIFSFIAFLMVWNANHFWFQLEAR